MEFLKNHKLTLLVASNERNAKRSKQSNVLINLSKSEKQDTIRALIQLVKFFQNSDYLLVFNCLTRVGNLRRRKRVKKMDRRRAVNKTKKFFFFLNISTRRFAINLKNKENP